MIVYPGSSTVIDRTFATSEVSITVKATDFLGMTIPTLTPVQVGVGTGVWRTTVAIPQNAPTSKVDTDYYKLIWTSSTGTVEQDFLVIGYDEDAQTPPPAAIGVSGVSMQDEIYLPIGCTNVTCTILDMSGSAVAAGGVVTLNDVTALTQYPSGANLSAPHPGSIKATVMFSPLTLGVGEYVAHWTFDVGANTQHDYRQAFVISIKTASVISNLRMFLDQAGVTRWLSHHHFHDVELVDCLYRSVERINITPPQQTSYTPETLPGTLVHAMRTGALYEMLNRLYLAEGMSTFDFQGGSITVSVDRTNYISTKMSELGAWLDTNLQPIKTAAVSSVKGSVGHLALTRSVGGLNNSYSGHVGRLNPAQFMLARANGFV